MSRQLTSGILGRKGIDIDLKIYLGSLTTALSSGQVALLDTFVKDLKTGLGITRLYDAFDQMLIHANETIESGLHNLVKRAHDATLSATAPTFTALEGFTGNGSSAFIDTNYNPNTQGVNYQLNNASLGSYSRTNLAQNSINIGVQVDNVPSYIWPRSTSDIAFLRMHREGGAASVTNNNSLGLFIASVTGTNASNLYRNKTSIKSDTSTVESTPNGNHYVLAHNLDGSPSNYCSRQISFVFTGRGFSPAEVNVITDTFEAYMDANGKGVIP